MEAEHLCHVLNNAQDDDVVPKEYKKESFTRIVADNRNWLEETLSGITFTLL